MDEKRLVRVSRFLSKHLRHQPERLGITLDSAGWAAVDDLLAACQRHGFALTRDELVEVVARNDKQRFSLDSGGTRVRANQGHSVPVELAFDRAIPEAPLYHGTVARFMDSISRRGLIRRGRHHVHLAADAETARRVGARRGRPVVLEVDAPRMVEDGFAFFLSANGVWLVAGVPRQYLREIAHSE